MIVRDCEWQNATDTMLMLRCAFCNRCHIVYDTKSFTAQDVRKVRDWTGADLNMSRIALAAADGDINEAIELIRKGSNAVYIGCSDFERRD